MYDTKVTSICRLLFFLVRIAIATPIPETTLQDRHRDTHMLSYSSSAHFSGFSMTLTSLAVRMILDF
jgi:hypothetical protein